MAEREAVPEDGRAPVKLALLMCDTPVPAVVSTIGTYLDVFRNQLRFSNPDASFPFILDGFDVVSAQEYPDIDSLLGGGYKGILISGSKHNAYDNDPWIVKLVSWVSDVARRRPDVKLIGICFGHQIIARAMGGKCTSNNGQWEVGTVDVELNDVGREVFMTDKPTIAIQQMHRDIVPDVPPSFENIGSSPVCAVQGLVKRYPNSSEIHILTVQGHPEFTADIVQAIIDVREKSGAMDENTVKDGRRRAIIEHDGIGAIGRAMWRVLGVNAPA